MSSILTKNELENVNFCPSLLGQTFFVRFWENWKKTKSPFEINWPLVGLHMRSVTNFLFPGCFEGTKVLLRRVHTKGGVISETLSIWQKCPKIGAKSLPWALYTQEKCSGEWFGTFFLRFEPKWKSLWDLATFEKISLFSEK